MANCDDNYDSDIYDDFCLDVRKKKKKNNTNLDMSVNKVLKKVQQLPLTKLTTNYFIKLVIDKKIIDVGEIIESSEKCTVIEAKPNVEVEPFEALKDDDSVLIEVLHNDDFCVFKGPIHFYSRRSNSLKINDSKSYKPAPSGAKYHKHWLTLLKFEHIVINRKMEGSLTLEQKIEENPTKIVKIFQEILNLILDVEVNDNFFWTHNANGANNVLFWKKSWIVLSGEFKVPNASFVANLMKVFDLFRKHGMSRKQLEFEFYKGFEGNVWRRRPRYVYHKMLKKYFKDS